MPLGTLPSDGDTNWGSTLNNILTNFYTEFTAHTGSSHAPIGSWTSSGITAQGTFTNTSVMYRQVFSDTFQWRGYVTRSAGIGGSGAAAFITTTGYSTGRTQKYIQASASTATSGGSTSGQGTVRGELGIGGTWTLYPMGPSDATSGAMYHWDGIFTVNN